MENLPPQDAAPGCAADHEQCSNDPFTEVPLPPLLCDVSALDHSHCTIVFNAVEKSVLSAAFHDHAFRTPGGDAIYRYVSNFDSHLRLRSCSLLANRYSESVTGVGQHLTAPRGPPAKPAVAVGAQHSSREEEDVEDDGGVKEAACSADTPCPIGDFCNYDHANSGVCEPCNYCGGPDPGQCNDCGLLSAGVNDCISACAKQAGDTGQDGE